MSRTLGSTYVSTRLANVASVPWPVSAFISASEYVKSVRPRNASVASSVLVYAASYLLLSRLACNLGSVTPREFKALTAAAESVDVLIVSAIFGFEVMSKLATTLPVFAPAYAPPATPPPAIAPMIVFDVMLPTTSRVGSS